MREKIIVQKVGEPDSSLAPIGLALVLAKLIVRAEQNILKTLRRQLRQ